MIYRVTVTPNAGVDSGKTLDAFLMGVGYNPTSNKFQLFLARADKDGAVRVLASDQIAKLTIGPPIVK